MYRSKANRISKNRPGGYSIILLFFPSGNTARTLAAIIVMQARSERDVRRHSLMNDRIGATTTTDTTDESSCLTN